MKTAVGRTVNRRERSRLIFYSLMIALPLVQFAVFYIYVNFNSFLLAFKTTDPLTYKVSLTLSNFSDAWKTFTSRSYLLKNSLTLFFWITIVGITFALIFSFYLYKRYPAHGLFKVILFLPKIIPTVVFSILFRYLVTDGYSALVQQITGLQVPGLLDGTEQAKFNTVLIYCVWMSFGVNVLLFTGAMEGINESVVESAKLDGVNIVQEFIHITVPMIFPTLTTFIVVGMAGIFTNQMELYSLFGPDGMHIGTLGFFLFVNANSSDVVAKQGYLSYHELAAMGLIFTFMVFPITLIVRKLLEKFGPSPD